MLFEIGVKEVENRGNSICLFGMWKGERLRWFLDFWFEWLEEWVVIYWERRLREK